MQENKTISLYANAIADGQKRRLLAAYRSYVSLARNLESIVSRHQTASLATVQVQELFPDISAGNPWSVGLPKSIAREAYTDFLINKNAPQGQTYCFVSWDKSTPDNTSGIMSVPEGYVMQSESNSLPHRIERYVAAHPKGALLKDTVFIINGNYALTYQNPQPDATVESVFNDTKAQKGFCCMLDILAQLPEDLYAITEKQLRTAQDEALASALTEPFENMILTSLAVLAEETERIIKKTASRRQSENYFYQAESNGFIPSASRFQDYINIRHLMHHQWDTLDNLGRYTFYNTEKNVSLRNRFLDSYSRLCDKPLSGRVKAYINAAADFIPLAAGLNPNFFVRGAGESNNKFLTRIKEYHRQNPDSQLLVETGYANADDKKKALVKNIQKVLPSAEIIDVKEMDIDHFMERIKNHLIQKKFLDVFAQIEYGLCQRSLFRGKTQTALKCWQDAGTDGLLTPAEVTLWANYKKLRNELSHKVVDETLNNELQQNFSPFLYAAITLEEKIKAQSPKVYLVEGNIFCAVHADGLEVEVDFAEKRVLKVSDSSANRRRVKAAGNKMQRTYSEEYPNGLSITIAGTNIIACRLTDGTQIDFKSRKITYPDKSRFYFNSADHYSLTAGNAKILTDNRFMVINYIRNGKSVTIGKNETILLPNGHNLQIGADGSLKEETKRDNNSRKTIVSYNKDNRPALGFADGTLLTLAPNNASLSHNGIKLTYLTRKEFAESYKQPFPPAMLKKNNER